MTWKKELFRDLEALGSYLFFVLVAARSMIGMHLSFFSRMAAGLVASLILWQIVKMAFGIKSSAHIMNSVILWVVINLYYESVGFAVFTFVLFAVMFYAHSVLRKHQKFELVSGFVIGVLASGIAVWVSNALFPVSS
jgi:hypothetical protein